MDSEQKPGTDLAHTQFNYEATPNPEFNDTPATGQALEQKSAQAATTSVTPTPTTISTSQSVAAPPVDTPIPATQVRPSELVPPDESKEADFSDAVAQAKQIIERTRDDPFAQSRELSELKAQVMKQHFNKDINTADGV